MLDVMIRWYEGYWRGSAIRRVRKVLDMLEIVPNPTHDIFTLPSLHEIINGKCDAKLPTTSVKGSEGVLHVGDKKWVPSDLDIQLRLMFTVTVELREIAPCKPLRA